MATSPGNPFVDAEGRALVAVSRGPRDPGVGLRTPLNGWSRERPREPDPALVERLHATIEALGGFRRFLRPGDTITIKPNFNSGDPPPNSTDIPMLVALIRLLRDCGAGRVVVGESTRHPPTNSRWEIRRTGVFEACRREGAEVVVFGDGDWTPVPGPGAHFRWLEVARPLLECDHLIMLACLKTHWLSKFSMSLKLMVGGTRPRHRALLHFGGHFDERIAELAATVRPVLSIVDGRTAFVRGGPCYGLVRAPNVLLASGDRVALDVESIRELQRYPECPLTRNPWTYRQIRAAVRLGLGAPGPQHYQRHELPMPSVGNAEAGPRDEDATEAAIA